MSNQILNHWDFPYPPRTNQNLAFDWLEQNRDKRYLVLEAPVGSGKSNVGITYSKYLTEGAGSSFILTPQKILQKQYEDSMRDIKSIEMASLYGKGNYSCGKGNWSCDVGSLLKPRCANCPHKTAKGNAVGSPNTVLNYKLALTSFAFTETFKPRKLMVCDEAHTLEQYLVDFDAAQVLASRCNKYNLRFVRHTDMPSAVKWLKDYYLSAMNDIINRLAAEVEAIQEKGSEATMTDVRKIKELDALYEHFDLLTSISRHQELDTNFVLVHDETMFQFKRITGAHSFNRIMEPFADQFLFMSSTILNKEGFCGDLGLDPDQTAFLSLESDFPVENRPVYYGPVMKVNASWKKNPKGQKSLVDMIESLAEVHEGESGIIHTGNFAIAMMLVEKLKLKQKVFHHNPDSDDDRGSVINAFLKYTKPAVLISPSCTEGLDLKGDLGRFAIFAKVPYGFLGDQWIKRRMDLSNEWYQRQALIHMVQGGGRVVRSGDDEGSVYILDECFAYLYQRNKYMLPKWWKDSYEYL